MRGNGDHIMVVVPGRCVKLASFMREVLNREIDANYSHGAESGRKSWQKSW